MRYAVLLLLALVFTSPANAKNWTTDYSKSHLTFTGKVDDQEFIGHFKKFQVTINFDPSSPGSGSIIASMDIASATTGAADRDAYLPQGDWFDSKNFPKALFTSQTIYQAGAPSCFEATGDLVIKGVSKFVKLPFCLTPQGDAMHAEGKLTINRGDYQIGTGQWADDGMVAHGVTVNFDILAK